MVVHTHRKNRIIIIFGSLAAIGPFSIDMYLSGFPSIARELGTDIEHADRSFSMSAIGCAAADGRSDVRMRDDRDAVRGPERYFMTAMRMVETASPANILQK